MKKEDNARMLDPDRFKIAKNMAVVPGGPMNNNGMNVTGLGNQSGSFSGVNQFPYGDSGLENDPRMGANMLNPLTVPNSGLQQNFPLGRGANQVAPYGMQAQPDTSGVSMAPDGMESGRLAQEVQQRGVPAGAMGYQGMPAIPGNLPENPAFSGPPMMQGMPSAEQAAGKGINMKTGKRGK